MATTATDDGPGLRPCPFCGGEAEMDDFHICCAGCGARLDFYGSPDAVARWNRRDGDRCAAGCVVRALADEVTGHMHSGPPGWPQTPEEEAAGPPPACLDCGLLYAEFGLDLTLPDHQWREVHPDGDGLLCATCICNRAAKMPGAIAVRGRVEV